jgi:hypothetical protein
VKGIPKSIEKKKRQKSHHRNISKSAIDHLFCQDHPSTFAEALHEQSFLRRVMADLGYHPTWDFYRLVLVPLWILDADSTKDQQKSRHELAIDRVNLLNGRLQLYNINGGREEQDKCQRLLDKHNEVTTIGDPDELPPWPHYLLGSSYIGTHCYECKTLEHGPDNCPQARTKTSDSNKNEYSPLIPTEDDDDRKLPAKRTAIDEAQIPNEIEDTIGSLFGDENSEAGNQYSMPG